MENFGESTPIGVGIDFGTSNSCSGVYINGSVKLVPNKLGERITPSVVLFKKLSALENDKIDKDEILVGEEALCESFDNLKNYIYEIKRFIGLDYSDFEEMNFKDSLNYDIENIDGKPKIKITIDNITKYYYIEQISYIIIKKIISNTETFISEITQKPKIKIKSAVFTVPKQFTDQQKESIKNAAIAAGIEETRIINEPTAAALAYGIGHDLSLSKKDEDMFSSTMLENNYSVAPSANQVIKTKEKLMTFDLGGGTFDLTILNISKSDDDTLNFRIELTEGDIHLGGSDFDKRLIDYCIKEFCEENEFDKDIIGKEILKDYSTYRRLKTKCENAKKLLSIKNQAIIKFDSFYKDIDLAIKINLDKFNEICQDLFDRIKNKVNDVLNENNITANDINNVILIGGSTRMRGIRNLLMNIFGENKIKSDINPDEAVAIGATLEAAKIQIQQNMKFVLQDIIPFDIGILIQNPDKKPNSPKEIIYPIINKYSKIPSSSEKKKFKVELSDRNPDLVAIIYEGNDKNNKFPKTKLGDIVISGLKKRGIFSYKIKLNVDVNGKLTGELISSDLNLHENIIFTKENKIGYIMDKKLKIAENVKLKAIGEVGKKINEQKKLIESSQDLDEKYNKLKDFSQIYEDLIKNYISFAKYNENLYEKIFSYTKELFNIYLDILKMRKDTQIIINKIKENMMNLITVQSYIEELMIIFKDIKNELADVYYTIFANYMEILNNEGIKQLSRDKKSGKKFLRYYAKLYFEQVFFGITKFVDSEKLKTIDLNIKKLYDTQKKINEEELNKLDSYAYYIEALIKDGQFLFGQSGLTIIAKKLEKVMNSVRMNEISYDEIQDIIDIFSGMINSFDKNENSIAEAFCLANIIKIYYEILHIQDPDKYDSYIVRFLQIMKKKEVDGIKWYSKIKAIIDVIQNK